MRRPYRQLPSSATDDCPAPGPPVARQQPQLLPFMLDTIISFYLEDYWGDPGEGKLRKPIAPLMCTDSSTRAYVAKRLYRHLTFRTTLSYHRFLAEANPSYYQHIKSITFNGEFGVERAKYTFMESAEEKMYISMAMGKIKTLKLKIRNEEKGAEQMDRKVVDGIPRGVIITGDGVKIPALMVKIFPESVINVQSAMKPTPGPTDDRSEDGFFDETITGPNYNIEELNIDIGFSDTMFEPFTHIDASFLPKSLGEPMTHSRATVGAVQVVVHEKLTTKNRVVMKYMLKDMNICGESCYSNLGIKAQLLLGSHPHTFCTNTPEEKGWCTSDFVTLSCCEGICEVKKTDLETEIYDFMRPKPTKGSNQA